MALLQIRDLDKYYGANPILRDVSLEIHPGEKWGLVGKNGCGKTTLMRIITGQEDYDRGSIFWSQNCQVGYLRQEADFSEVLSIYDELRGIFRELDELQNQLNTLQGKMSEPGLAPSALEALIEEHHRLSEEFAQRGGYQIEGRIQGVLRGLGIPKERWNDTAASFSGGERTRLGLARILLTANDILLLDEPTNYLDIVAIEWLEEFLISFPGAVLLISHDRFFLDRVVQGIMEMEDCRITRYKGNYTAYRQKKEADYQVQLKAYELQQKEISRQEKLIRESRATEKSKRKAHNLEKRLQHLERIDKPRTDGKTLKMAFGGHEPSGKKVLEIEGLTKNFAERQLLKAVDFTVYSGQKVGLIGPNGSGKTTLLRMVMGLEEPDQGRIRLGYEVDPGYFSQFTAESDLEGTPFSQVMAMADLDNTQARTILARFLFQGDDVFKAVTDLSGGERRRLGLIRLILSKANFLILDEPTNHLDLQSIEVLEQALADYQGTVLVVSHDRYFLNQVANRFLLIDAGSVIPFDSYDEYLAWHSRQAAGSPETAKPRSEAQIRRAQTKEAQRELKRKQRTLEQLETAIFEMEARKTTLTETLSDPANSTDYKKSLELSTELNACEAELARLYEAWEQLQTELAELETEP
ncbi:ATP-binding cassette subfamily F protein 3 [Hydrogenispora ethanolica]|uniref:ATP-binding cassette subfamily F protein 3 n=1 Tax=Hydrogenispora ethanolica TaxID=1082276 RepID=A0A4R1RF19_HYDET|nr:ABC-F family ATP-binding cassette domain-containing protein [Hydrogenispora ethanolica]TCL64240.1 ATP-binding cassette subfamily F protein 3 [Hydrogenispora ethanolica]